MGYRSTVTPPNIRPMSTTDRWLVDPVTNSIVGVLNPNAAGEDLQLCAVDLTAAQLAAPTAEMIADVNVVYRLNVIPYTQYYSDGQSLLPVAGDVYSQRIIYAPWTISASVSIQGECRVYAWPT